jgi:dTDP-glucose pyrophosphorylase
LCLAGKGQRFVDEGYSTPKFLLTDSSGTESILSLIIKNFLAADIKNFFLVLNKKHQSWEEQIKNSISQYSNLKYTLIFIDDTSGQAESAYRAIQHINDRQLINLEEPIAFHNGDTVLFKRNFQSIVKDLSEGADGAIDTFPATSNAYSYVKVSHQGNIICIKEKTVISKKATSGLYIFKDCKTFVTGYEKTLFSHHEKYISEVYQEMIKRQSKILNSHNNRKQDTLILGTPSEYEHWKKSG